MVKKKLKVSQSILRKFHFIFTKKQKELIMLEASYYNTIYPALTIEETLEVVIQKHIKMKLHKIVFPDISKQLKEHKMKLEEIF